jgi:ribosomal protein S12 methylthiotransferase
MKESVGILSLGCPRNLVDSESLLGRLRGKGHRIVEITKADIGIINTCAFIEDAKRESIEAILDLVELKKSGQLKKIIVYGCLAQRYGQKLKTELPEVDAFVGRVSLNHTQDFCRITPAHYAYLKICEGCVNNCSYCVIPRIKGRFASLRMSSALKRAKELDREGVTELNIIGQDISGYGLDLYQGLKLTDLLKKIIRATSRISWLRLLYLYPSRVSEDLLKLIADEGRLCKYLDLPIQHINSRILKLMRRHTRSADIRRLIERARRLIPDLAIRTSVIVGFPSETDAEFKELLRFIEEVKFERLGAFIYSREEGTPAYNFKGQIPQRVQRERFNAVMRAQQEISRENNQKFLGQVLEVLIDEKEDGHYLGRTQYDAPEVDGLVYVHSARPLRPGDLVRVRIKDTLEYDLTGEVVL